MKVDLEEARLNFRFPANEADASVAVAALHASISDLGLSENRSSDAQIALAEAVNNVVEHAYFGVPKGLVSVKVKIFQEYIEVTVSDTGHPLPGSRVPEGVPASVDTDTRDLPEGGFGWFLIRKLSDSVVYDRSHGQNRLVLRFNFGKNVDQPQ
ncbi:MAG: ATP-binding protein [Ruegeria sp.]